METNLLILPGLGNSGEKHWQTFWHKKFKNSTRVVQDNWDEPIRKEWLERLNEEIIKIEAPYPKDFEVLVKQLEKFS